MAKRKYRRKTGKKTTTGRWGAGRVICVVIVALAAICFGIIAYCRTGTVLPTEELFDGLPTIRFIDVGQGDCTLVTYQGDSVLIDAGPGSSGEIAAEYVRMYAPVVDYFIITHPHEDHIGGAADVLSSVAVKTLIMPNITVEEDFFTNTIEAAQLQGTDIIWLDDAASFQLGGITIDILDTFDFEYDDLNDASLITRVTVGETTLLVTGDAETGVENYLLENSRDALDCDVLKVGHHGSKTSTGQEFLEAVSPETCVISVGRGNSYGHPTEKVLERIEEYGADLHRTDREGNVVLRGDAENGGGLLDLLRVFLVD